MTINTDSLEIDKFNQVAHTWWDSDGPFKTLHEINPLRLDFIKLHAPLNNKHVIDIGCGGGLLSEAMAQLNAEVTGIDMSEDALITARNHCETSNLKVNYQLADAESYAALHPNEFEVVTCLELLEHVPDPHSLISACSGLCKPGGMIFFSTINRNLKSFLLAIVGAEYITGLVPKGTHEYRKFIKPSELNRWALSCSLQLVDIKGIQYNPVTHQHKLCNDVGVNFIASFNKPK